MENSKGAVSPANLFDAELLFVSHEATRTGAPRIILNLLRHFQQGCDVQCETILHSGGYLATEFAELSITDCMNLPKEDSIELKKRVTQFANREKQNLPIMAICNSMESRFVTSQLNQLGIPTISLIHELPSSYSEADYQTVFTASDKVVFPAHAVRDAADAKTPIPIGKSVVLPQGLLDPAFGKNISHSQARKQIRAELGLPENAMVVLGCGTLDLRKGIDHYATIARHVIQTNHSDRPIHFVWVGEGHRWPHSPYHYVQLDLKKSAAHPFVHFIGERADVEPYFMGADLFLMTSRVDPFPCVIHEAMAARLPIIAFDNTGGTPEAIENGAGFVIPYADYQQASELIKRLASQPDSVQLMCERALARVHSRYRFEEYAEKMLGLCESILGQRIRRTHTPPQRLMAA